jgi:hypothetical protein
LNGEFEFEKSSIPIHKDITIPKRILQRLPSGFEKTTLGYVKDGALAQYRGSDAIHVHEYPDHWLFHKDYGDPRTFEGLLAHLLFDAPEIPLSIMAAGASGIAVGNIVYEMRKNKSKDAEIEAIFAGILASLGIGAITFLLARKK